MASISDERILMSSIGRVACIMIISHCHLIGGRGDLHSTCEHWNTHFTCFGNKLCFLHGKKRRILRNIKLKKMWLCFSTLQPVYLFDCNAINCTFVFQWIDMFCCRWQLEALNILTYWYWSWLSTKYSLTVINTTLYRESWQFNQLLVISLACITQLVPYPGTGHDTSTSRHRLLLSSDIFSFPSFKTPLSKIFFNRSSSIYHDYHARYISSFL